MQWKMPCQNRYSFRSGGGYPIPGVGGVPHPRSWWWGVCWVPPPTIMTWPRYPPDLRWGTPLPTIQTWMGYPPPQTWDGVPPHHPNLDSVPPHPRPEMGNPSPDLRWGTPPPPHHPNLDRVPPTPDLRWGTPSRPEMEYPPPHHLDLDRVPPPRQVWTDWKYCLPPSFGCGR